MSKTLGVSILIFLVDGTANGLRIVERSNWTGVVLMAPAAEPTALLKRKELDGPGVYLLVGELEDALPPMYVGEADDVAQRLAQHLAKPDHQWRYILVATRKDMSMNKAHVRWLERSLIELAQKANKATLVNKQSGFNSSLHEAEIATMESYLDDLLTILPLVGVDAFEVPQIPSDGSTELYTCTGPDGVSCKGFESGANFVVTVGTVRKDAVPSTPRVTLQRREQLRTAGVLSDAANGQWLFTEPYSFASPTAAAGVVLGRSANGLTEWKNAKGATLKAVRALKADLSGK